MDNTINPKKIKPFYLDGKLAAWYEPDRCLFLYCYDNNQEDQIIEKIIAAEKHQISMVAFLNLSAADLKMLCSYHNID